MTSSLVGIHPGNSVLASRLAKLSNPELAVVRAIKKNCGPSWEQIHWALDHHPHTKRDILALEFRLEIGRRDQFPIHLNIDSQFGIGDAQFMGTVATRTLRDLGLWSDRGPLDLKKPGLHAFITYDARKRTGFVTIMKETDEAIERYLTRLKKMCEKV